MSWRGSFGSILGRATAPFVQTDPPAGRFEQATGLALLIFGLVLPTIVGLVTPYVILAIGLGLWLVLLAMGRLPTVYRPLSAKLLLIAFAILAVLFVLSMRSWRDPLFAFNFTMLCLFGPLLWLFARAAGEKQFVRVVSMAAVGVGLTLVMVVYQGIVQAGRPRGFNLGPIVLSNAALALAVVATSGALVMRSRTSLLLPLTLIAAIATIIITQSRGPLVAVLPLLMLTGIFLWRERFTSWLFIASSGVAAVLAAAATIAFAGGRLAQLPAVILGVLGAGGQRDYTTGIRLALYEAAWKAFLESPWVGHGWARLMTSALPYVDPQYLEAARKLPQLHNDVLNFAVAGGIVGVGVYLVIIATPLIAALRSGHDRYRAARIYATSGLAIVYVGGGLTDLMFGHEFHTALYVVLVAIVLGFFRETPSSTADLSPAGS